MRASRTERTDEGGERDAKAGVRTDIVHADSGVGSASVVRVSYAVEKRRVTRVKYNDHVCECVGMSTRR